MILIASMSRPETYDESGGDWKIKRRFERLTGHPCIEINYPDVTRDFVKRYGIRAVFITGFGYGWDLVSVANLKNISQFLHETDLPVLGACGGHQLIGHLFNRDLSKTKKLFTQPMRKLRRGEPDIEPDYHPGYLKEHGVYEVTVRVRDPLFHDLPNRIKVPEYHYGEIKKLPRDFLLLASNDACRIQAIRHKEKPLYGTQFHPELWDEAYRHGEKILINFFRIAGLIR